MSMVQELWHRVTGTQPVPAVWIVVVSGLAALFVVVNPRTWHVARNAITIAHEGGHALVSVLSGRRLEGIRLHADTSGVTYSRGRRNGPGMVLTAAAGYVTPSVLGAGSAWLLAAHHVSAMLWLLLALLAATFLAVRNWYGALAVLLTAGAICAITLLASAAVQAIFGYGTAWFLLLGGVRPVAELHRERSRSARRGWRARTDADQLALLTRMPGGLWVMLFGLVAVAALVLGARLLVPGPLHVPHLPSAGSSRLPPHAPEPFPPSTGSAEIRLGPSRSVTLSTRNPAPTSSAEYSARLGSLPGWIVSMRMSKSLPMCGRSSSGSTISTSSSRRYLGVADRTTRRISMACRSYQLWMTFPSRYYYLASLSHAAGRQILPGGVHRTVKFEQDAAQAGVSTQQGGEKRASSAPASASAPAGGKTRLRAILATTALRAPGMPAPSGTEGDCR